MEKKKIIFIIESNKEILEMFQLILRTTYEVHAFIEPPENFLSMLNNKKPDLLIMDWLIPNINTEDLIHPVKTSCDDNIKIVIMSAHQSVHKAFRDKPVDAILQKPFGAIELKKLISNLFSSETQVKNIK
jgi:DNA-binding NtrC family response regulator